MAGFRQEQSTEKENPGHFTEALRLRKTLEPFMDRYESVFSINTETDTFRAFKDPKRMCEKYADCAGFQEFIGRYIEDYLLEADKPLLRKKTAYPAITEALGKASRHTIEYRVLVEDKAEFQEMIFAPLNHENEILMACVTDDLRIIQRNISKKMEEDCFAVDVVDLDMGHVRVLKESPYYSVLHVGTVYPYVQVMQRFAACFEGETREIFSKLADLDYLKKELAVDDKRTMQYKSSNIEGGRWVYIRAYVIKRHEDGGPAVISLSFSLVDAKRSIQQEMQEQIAQHDAFTQYFLKAYISAYYIDLESLQYKAYKQSDRLSCSYPVISRYDVSLKSYIDAEVHPEDREKAAILLQPQRLKEMLAEQKEINIVFRSVFDGREDFIRVTVIRGADENHVALGFRDITEEIRQQQEKERKERESTEIIRGLASAYNILHYVDLDSGSYTVTSVASEVDFIYSHCREFLDFKEMFEYYVGQFVHPMHRERMLPYADPAYVKGLLAHKKTDIARYLRQQGDGYIWMEQIYVKIEGDNEEAHHAVWACINKDAEVRAEEAQQKKLEEALSVARVANRAKTSFLNNMSHDIRTPMNAITGFTDLAAKYIDDKERVRDYLNKIRRSSGHLLTLINDVLEISRIESGTARIEDKEEDLRDIVTTIRDLLQPSLNDKRHTFTVIADGIRNNRIVCDKLRLNQILLNILSNSVKYTAPGGQISLRIGEKAAKSDRYGTYEFSVRDNGIGMDREFLRNLFEPFVRMKSSTVSGIQGTGLGMAITKNLVDLLGGTIEVESEVGKGTTMTVTLDLKLAEEQDMAEGAGEKKHLADYDFAGKKVLLVEDNELNLEIAMELLKEYGFVVDTAEDGSVALSKMKEAKAGDYDVILMDIQMPIMDGYEATRKIRALGTEISKIPILAMTANAFEEDRKKALAAGMNDHIAKPIDVERFEETLMRFL